MAEIYTTYPRDDPALIGAEQRRLRRMRILIFACVFSLFACGGLIYDYSRSATYRATARLSVDPPGFGDDTAAKAQFAVSEAQAMRRSDYMTEVSKRVQGLGGAAAPSVSDLERWLTAESVAQTTVIELRADGPDRGMLASVLSAWIDVYTNSRKEADRGEESEALAQARHEAEVARKAVEAKRRDMDIFRQRSGIVSVERDENPSAARLRGLHNALNDAATREVNAEARLKALTDNLAQGGGVVRAADKAAIAGLEMRAVEMRARVKDLEHDYTQQYLALDPKYRALKANLARAEQQIEQEKERSQKAALVEAQEEFAGAQRAAQKIREQAESLKQESQIFSTRFVELKRLGAELEQLQETRRVAAERVAKLESARKPSAVQIRILSAPSAGVDPIAPNYSRDAAIALGAALVLGLIAVWTHDFLRRETPQAGAPGSQPIIQIAYPMLQPQPVADQPAALPSAPAGLLANAIAPAALQELTAADVAALWTSASSEGKLIVSAMFAGVAPCELGLLAWSHVDLASGVLSIPGPSARSLPIVAPLHQALDARAGGNDIAVDRNALLLADKAGNAFDEAAIDRQLAFAAHDAGLRHPEQITAQVLQFTYAAFLARQGMRMADLVATLGRIVGPIGSQLMRLAPPGLALPVDRIERVFPSFRGQFADHGDQTAA